MTIEQVLKALKADPAEQCPSSDEASGCYSVFGRAKRRRSPAINVEILFDNASASLNPKAMLALKVLDDVLRKSDFDKYNKFNLLIAGHANASGSQLFNERLSERRADAVKRALVQTFKLPEDLFVTTGYGISRPKNPNEPFSGENRRVQIVSTQSN